MDMEMMHLLRLLLVLLCSAPQDVLGADKSCNLTQVRECYSSILESVVVELRQQRPEPSLHKNLCKKYGTTSRCQADAERCLPSFPAVRDMERLYSTVRQEACRDPTFTLLRSLAPTAKCAPLPAIVRCVETRHLQFDNSTEDAKAACHELENGLLGCFAAPDAKCPKHRRRATNAMKTLATMMEIRGCDARGGNASMQNGGRTQGGAAGRQDGADGRKCSYKTIRRCNERQINAIRTKMTKLLARNMLPDDNFSSAICRKTRQTCHQHSTVESCVEHEQGAIRRLEEAMDEAQALLCTDDRALLKNLLLSYKWWNIEHFTKCSTDIQVNSITDFLYNRPRIHSDCRLLRSRLSRCLEESYAAADEADPKPDVNGARMVLAIFLNRMTCVDAADLPLVDDGTSGLDDTGSAYYPADEDGGNGTDARGSAMPVISDVESCVSAPAIRKSALAGVVLLTMVLTRDLAES